MKEYYGMCADVIGLEKENARMREALEKIEKEYFCNKPFWGIDECSNCTILCIKNIAKQALKQRRINDNE